MRTAALVALALVCVGCAAPSEPAKQADEIASIAAEGALLAHDAAEGATTSAFTRVHAQALRKNLRKLEPKLAQRELARLADVVDGQLERLADNPGDETRAGVVERRLEEAKHDAEQLAG